MGRPLPRQAIRYVLLLFPHVMPDHRNIIILVFTYDRMMNHKVCFVVRYC
jgi:hypothetical protein